MTVEYLSNSEAHSIDLIALRAWHWKASMDANRDHEMRAWHRDQVKWINLRIAVHGGRHITSNFTNLVELMAVDARHQVNKELRIVCAGDWEMNCQLAREAIIAKMAG